MKTSILISSKQYTGSTLLVPKRILTAFRKQVKSYGSVAVLLKNVLERGQGNLSEIKGSRTGKIVYQQSGQMERINFRPLAKDWEMLRNLAYAKRISMTYMFVLLLLAMVKGGSGIVPTIPDKILLNYTYIDNKLFIYLELERITP